MADVSQINLPDGSSFNVKDAVARSTKADRVLLPAEYDATATYYFGDLCTHEGNVYWCKVVGSVTGTWTASYWQLCNPQQDYLHSINPVGNGSFSLNRKDNTTIGNLSFAEGKETTASGTCSHAEGANTTASANCSHAEGGSTTASHPCSHAEGFSTSATGAYSHSEGGYTLASGDQSHAEGQYTRSLSYDSHSEGYYTTAKGYHSHAEGCYTTASHRCHHVFGEYNVEDSSTAARGSRGNYLEIVGNGTADDARSNARTLDWNGNEVLAGGLKINGTQNVATQVELTQAEYDALVQAGTVDLVNTVYFITDGNANANSASETTYDNTSSGLTATNVQDAIDEVDSALNDKQDTLTTTSGTITANTSGGWGVYGQLKKYGNVVSFYIDANKSSALESGWNTIGTLQSGFRPAYNFDFAMIDPGSDYASEGKVTTDGIIQVYKNSNSTTRIRAQATFII